MEMELEQEMACLWEERRQLRFLPRTIGSGRRVVDVKWRALERCGIRLIPANDDDITPDIQLTALLHKLIRFLNRINEAVFHNTRQLIKIRHKEAHTKYKTSYLSQIPRWNEELLTKLFNERDKQQILSVTLPIQRVDDKWIWWLDKYGKYSVKSGYTELLKNHTPSSAHQLNWSSVWNLEIPPKIKNFLWCVLTNSLPTKVALIAKHVELEPTCSAESFESIFCWWNSLRNRLSKPQMEQVVGIAWKIWDNRNKHIWKGSIIPAVKVVQSGAEAVQDWKIANSKPTKKYPSVSIQKNYKFGYRLSPVRGGLREWWLACVLATTMAKKNFNHGIKGLDGRLTLQQFVEEGSTGGGGD
ncbi:hypothetical protein LguiA_017828 [Lonicera macranthoides]